jgi:hypothetical protein
LFNYKETNWKYDRCLDVHKYDLPIHSISASKTIKERQAKIEKISLVAFLNKDQRQSFVNLCRRLKKNDKDFYKNKNLHAIVFGFGPLKKKIMREYSKKFNNSLEKIKIAR